MLDLSWNSIGSLKSKKFATQLAEVLQTQDNLIHLDISQNKIKAEDMNIVATSLELNHSLWGFHVVGNEAYVDSKGFLHAEKQELNQESLATQHLDHRMCGTKMVVFNTDREDTKVKRINNCWLCEGWNEVLIEWPKSILKI